MHSKAASRDYKAPTPYLFSLSRLQVAMGPAIPQEIIWNTIGQVRAALALPLKLSGMHTHIRWLDHEQV